MAVIVDIVNRLVTFKVQKGKGGRERGREGATQDCGQCPEY